MEKQLLDKTVQEAKNGSENAQQELYRAYAQPVYFLALKLLKNKEDAEDIMQEVFLTAFQKLPELEDGVAFPHWLNRITANKATDYLRKRKEPLDVDISELEGVADFPEEDPLLIPEQYVDNAETSRIIIEVIDSLPLPQRAVIYYYYFEGLTISQIAETLACAEGTVKSRLAVARAKIREALEKKEKEEGIKLYAMPLLIAPVLRIASQQFEMPSGLLDSVWNSITIQASATTATTATATTITATSTVAETTGGIVMALKTKILLAVAGVVVLGGITTAVILANSGNDAEVVPAVAPITTTAPIITTTPQPAEPEESECIHNWTEANFQQPQTCIECGETQGDVLTPFFEENGFIVNMVLGQTYPYRTRTFDNPDLEITGDATIIDYRIVELDENREAKEGYEWRTVQVLLDFVIGGSNQRFSFADYYTGELIHSKTMTVNFNGADYECEFDMVVLKNELSISLLEFIVLVPVGYDGIVLKIINSVHMDAENWVDTIDEYSLLFRLVNIEQTTTADEPIISEPEPPVTTTTTPPVTTTTLAPVTTTPAPVVTTTPAPVVTTNPPASVITHTAYHEVFMQDGVQYFKIEVDGDGLIIGDNITILRAGYYGFSATNELGTMVYRDGVVNFDNDMMGGWFGRYFNVGDIIKFGTLPTNGRVTVGYASETDNISIWNTLAEFSVTPPTVEFIILF
jgi:RNA polymerase sigma-70 factor (ECF subfamily)